MRDLTSVEPDRHRSLTGRQTLGEPTRRRQAIHEPTRPTTYQTLRTSARINRYFTYKSAIHFFAEGSGPMVLVKVERPQRSEDERP
jgi:hypothetical protein